MRRIFVAGILAAVIATWGAVDAYGLTHPWEAVACRNHIYTKITKCEHTLKSNGFVIEKEELAHHWEVERAYRTKAAAATEVHWLRHHDHPYAILEHEE
jgi:hypothetical protein